MKIRHYARVKKTIIAFVVAMACSAMASGAAFAHKVTIFAWVDGDTVHTLSKFSGGKKVKTGRIIVYDADGEQLLEGETDKNGEFSFKPPKKTDLRIELIAGMGHKNHWTIPVEDFATDAPGPKASEADADAPKQEPLPDLKSQEKEPLHDGSGERRGDEISREIQAAVEKALDKKLKPVLKMLAESQDQKPTFQDILGGIGYIFGLMGVAAYVHSRRKNGEDTTQAT